MVVRFSCSLDPIVTSDASHRNGAMVHTCAKGKTACVMAYIALRDGRNMCNAFSRSECSVMATAASSGNAFKYPIAMTAFTGNEFVTPGQRKPGGKMIEISIRR